MTTTVAIFMPELFMRFENQNEIIENLCTLMNHCLDPLKKSNRSEL